MATVQFSDASPVEVNLAPEKTIDTVVNDINYIPGYKQAEIERRAYYEDFKQSVEAGEFVGETGEQGVPGKDGVTPNIQIGSVTTLDFEEEARVTKEGTQEEPVLNFYIPRGRPGEVTGDIDYTNMYEVVKVSSLPTPRTDGGSSTLTSTETSTILNAVNGVIARGKLPILYDSSYANLFFPRFTQSSIKNLIKLSFNSPSYLLEGSKFVPTTIGNVNIWIDVKNTDGVLVANGNSNIMWDDKITVLSTNNTRVYEPVTSYHPATKKYVDDAVKSATPSVDLSNYLAKDNTTEYVPTGDYNPATKSYVDGLIGGAGGSSAPIFLETGTTSDPILLSDLEPGIYVLKHNVNSYLIKASESCTSTRAISPLDRVLKVVANINDVADGDVVALYVDRTMQLGTITRNDSATYGITDTLTDYSTVNPFVKTGDSATIRGSWSFRTIPSTNVAPTTNNHLTNKAYVDSLKPVKSTFTGSFTSVDAQYQEIEVDVPTAGMYLVNLHYHANQGKYADNIICYKIGDSNVTHNVRNTWEFGTLATGILDLEAGTQKVAEIACSGSHNVEWTITLVKIGG